MSATTERRHDGETKLPREGNKIIRIKTKIIFKNGISELDGKVIEGTEFHIFGKYKSNNRRTEKGMGGKKKYNKSSILGKL